MPSKATWLFPRRYYTYRFFWRCLPVRSGSEWSRPVWKDQSISVKMDKRYPNRSLLNLYDRRKGNIEFYIVQQLATSKSIEAIVQNKKTYLFYWKGFYSIISCCLWIQLSSKKHDWNNPVSIFWHLNDIKLVISWIGTTNVITSILVIRARRQSC